MGDAVKDFEETLLDMQPFRASCNSDRALIALKRSWPAVKALLNGAARPDSALLAALERWDSSRRGLWSMDALPVRDAYRRWKAEHGARSEAERRVVEAAKVWRDEFSFLPLQPYAEPLRLAVDALAALDRPKPRYSVESCGSVVRDNSTGAYLDIPACAARLNAAAEGRP